MRSQALPPQVLRLTLGARTFGLVVLGVPVMWSRDSEAALALLAIGSIWLASTAAEALRVSHVAVTLSEAALIGTVCALSLDASLAVLGALAVPPFAASLRSGPRGMLQALSAELVGLVVVSGLVRGAMHTHEGTGAFTWAVTGMGLGLIGSYLRATLSQAADPLTPYRDAQALIRELIDLSGSLSTGLDPLSLGSAVAEAVRDKLPIGGIVVLVPHGEELRPLLTEAEAVTLERLEALALESQRTVAPVRDGNAFAVPLMTDVGLVAVIAGLLPERLDADSVQVDARLAELVSKLEPAAVHLDTALLFTAFRDAATADERRRLAREMHDGIAQEIASLGYLVDGLAAGPSTPQQAAQLRVLRHRISAVVSEVRRNVQSLRTEVGASASLGAAIGGLARHLSASSGIPIHVTMEERTTRLRTEVEAELLRIAQEAMTNAVRHAHATRIDVSCRVDAPAAEISVRDDGRGIGPGRDDSQGIEIMHERARLVGAQLTLTGAEPRGTVVTVTLAGTPSPAPGTGAPTEARASA